MLILCQNPNIIVFLLPRLYHSLHVPNGPMIQSKIKALKEALNALVLKVSIKSDLKGPLEYQEEVVVHLIHVQKGPNPTLFGP